MDVNPNDFSDEERRRLAHLVSDLEGPTCTSWLLEILDEVGGLLAVETMQDRPWVEHRMLSEIRSDLDICIAALQYARVHGAIQTDVARAVEPDTTSNA